MQKAEAPGQEAGAEGAWLRAGRPTRSASCHAPLPSREGRGLPSPATTCDQTRALNTSAPTCRHELHHVSVSVLRTSMARAAEVPLPRIGSISMTNRSAMSAGSFS